MHESAWARPAWPGRTAQGAGHRPSWPCRMCRRVAESARQTYMDRSSPADAMCIPSGENATEVTFEVCPRKVCSGCPLHASHSLQELSLPPETMRSPFEEKASERISPWCALSTEITSRPVEASQTRNPPSTSPLASCEASIPNAAHARREDNLKGKDSSSPEKNRYRPNSVEAPNDTATFSKQGEITASCTRLPASSCTDA